MTNKKIQTMHPIARKTNKNISLEKYDLIKTYVLAILQNNEMTYTELMESHNERVGATLDGGVQWYGETIKLDLETR